ncbi:MULTISPECIES: hypothetical protein [Microbacterium]|uniref:Uncharacterized protein n=1 Tax=Microbacterium oxydans TaxID=82380 RepID=A0A3Q9J2T5_9MICO|nr:MULTISPECIES: hypothetical protein [Microbacterium]AZS39160.1 hypothetical protein CVS54_00461 [Microbacterium oxydans]NYF29487.1 hypothetical protein [Microbacterium sp. JAI119]
MVRTQEALSVKADRAVDERLDVDDLPGIDRGSQRCECDHGDDDGYQPCGRKAKWRVTVDCVCGEGHPRRVEILCSRCMRTLRQFQGREAITVRRL